MLLYITFIYHSHHSITFLFLFFSSSGIHQSHHLNECHAIGINSLTTFFYIPSIFTSLTTSNRPNKIYSIKVIIMKVYINKAYIIIKECNIIRITITKVYILLKNTALSRSLNIFRVTNQSETNFNAGRQPSTVFSHIFGCLYLLIQYFGIQGLLRTGCSLIS